MEWILKIKENPIDIKYPIEGMQVADNGAKRGPFFFSIDDAIAALNEIEPMETQYMPLPIPPQNTAYYTHTKDMTQFKVILDIPKAIQTIRYEYRDIQRVDFIGFPRVLCSIEVTKAHGGWKLTDSRLYAVEDNVKLVPQTRLSHFPFPNVYKDYREGAICWGANQLPIFKELRDLEGLFHLFLQAPFNEDLGTRILAKKKGMTFLSYLEQIENNGQPAPFNDEDLVPCAVSFGDLMETKVITNEEI
ncbi:hypothetical protein D7X33_20205 [Butyricicoccus sp. 1XD8-22]|nr:hypothetical protein D7X33_20205 [Butyricicoccus sp. 1XD8-22]